jgi:redox-sensitive bicupin YhaK (pirin superfamily)
MSAPRYQTLLNASIPQVDLAAGGGMLRVIAGSFEGRNGPASTFSVLNVWDVRLRSGHKATLPVPHGHSTAIAVLRGSIVVNGNRDGSRPAGPAELLVLDRSGDEVQLEAHADSTLLLLSGVPIEEPVVGYGPFVMNSREEIETAIQDFQRGKFGAMPQASAQTQNA